MKNILYVAPYKQTDGWGNASKQYLKSIAYACKKMGYNLQVKPIYLSNNIDFTPDPSIAEYENNRLRSIDTIIQKALPQAICPIYPYKNIAICVFEQMNLGHSSYIKQVFNRMDFVLVPSRLEKETIQPIISTPVGDISQPIDLEEINSLSDDIDANPMDIISLNSKYKDYIKFYFVGSFVPRKNIINLILAFNNEFQDREKALLVIKTDKLDAQRKEIIINDLKATLSRNKHRNSITKNLVLITDNLDRQTLIRLHKACDIFVCPSKGEAFCRPLAESLALGKVPMAVEYTGASELIDPSISGFIIPSRLEMSEANPNNISLNHECELEYCSEPTILDIRKKLREAYNYYRNLSDDHKSDLSNRIKTYSNRFSIENIGEKLCSLDIM